MPEILTTEFKADATRRFANDVENNDYYIFASSINEIIPADTEVSKTEFLEKVIFGKKIKTRDTHFMIRYYPWQRDDVFVQYDDSEELEGQKFYCVVGPNDNDTGDYRVYKCLFNNYGAGVTSPPAFNESSADQIYRTADGYIWKYMYVISELEFDAYNSQGFVPIVGDYDTNPSANTGGGISDIIVQNNEDNFGYVEETGRVTDTDIVNSVVEVFPDGTFNPIEDYYVGQSIYFTNPDSSTFLYQITAYNYDDQTGRADIRLNIDPVTQGGGSSVVKQNASFSIFPTIKIEGDGSGAVAIPTVVDGRISTIIVLNPGDGYNNVTAQVVDPAYDFDPSSQETTDVRASIRAVLTPDSDHGYNLINEFRCRHYSLYAYITTDDNNIIPNENTYASVGIVKNPQFSTLTPPEVFDNRIEITTANADRVTANTTVVQISSETQDVTFSGRVHEIDETNDKIYLAHYMGPYQNNANTGNGDTSLDLTRSLRNETGQIIEINTPAADNVVVSPYIQRSGKVYFMENFFPLNRTSENVESGLVENTVAKEEFKIVLEF